MSEQSNQNTIRDEVAKEFKLERMILFSDAVFAIVITLMAIEIHLPETSNHSLTKEELISAFIHLSPTILAYVTSFVFIGIMWNQHLQLFGLLKSFDKGLVFRNLLLLFFVGLFPFAATVISKGPKTSILPMMIYMTIILCCIAAFGIIEHYIFFKKPELLNGSDISDFLEKHRLRKITLFGFGIAIIMVVITANYISDPRFSFLSTMWIMLVPLSYAIFNKKKKKIKSPEKI